MEDVAGRISKRMFDLFFSFVLLGIFGFPMLVIAGIILFSMGKPVLFRQLRPGYKGKPFMILKFRTMRNAAGPNGELLSDEERLTALGKMLRKFSLDELPQLINVFKGELSFVGPRPLLMQYLSLYTPRQAKRHDVKPGITGWTQVNGRNTLSWDQKFDFDVWYVENQSFFLDMKILCLTVVKVVRREGITAEGSATMPVFEGSEKEKNV